MKLSFYVQNQLRLTSKFYQQKGDRKRNELKRIVVADGKRKNEEKGMNRYIN